MRPLSLDRAEIAFAREGSGEPAFVLVHGGMCDHRDWDRLAPLLAKRHAVIRPDLRGHGRSTGAVADCSIARWADDVLALVAALDLRRPVLVGHSLASRIAAQAAAAAPGALGGIVLLDGSRTHGGQARSAQAQPAGTPSPEALAAVIAATIGPHADAAARAAVSARMASASAQIMAACVAAMREWDEGEADRVFAALAGGLPVLAIQSTYHDAATPRRSLQSAEESTPYLDFLRGAVPQLEVSMLERTGHFAMLERPRTVAALLTDFARRAGSG